VSGPRRAKATEATQSWHRIYGQNLRTVFLHAHQHTGVNFAVNISDISPKSTRFLILATRYLEHRCPGIVVCLIQPLRHCRHTGPQSTLLFPVTSTNTTQS
jgi:hypothetical protein